ncbi:serine hydrolase domain-containing protein [Robertkochia aurantiaca]|uniref:serine hydrolase domain-containing protein n=1 Tax=Robertkochia aurantiaca TaxID=2873700 RepID=UPI001CC9BCE0|nr:serine hydrolase [Robertkochia sp. 3YJGBD-33]
MHRAFFLSFFIFSLSFYTSPFYAQSAFPLESVEPQTKGFSREKLDSLSLFLNEAGSSALMILVDGKVVYEWGATDEKLLVHSIRKALINSLYGIYVDKGVIDTTATLKDLKIDSLEQGLTEKELSATVADLLKSRSGVYRSAAAVNAAMLRNMPEKGSHEPGTYYYYNNWDFNTLGHILESRTGKSLYDLFYEHIAKPLGMDYANEHIKIYDPEDDMRIPDVDGFYQYESEKSVFPAYHFRLSARDLALYGQLWLNKGKWQGEQLIPESWIEVSTKAYSMINPSYGIGYGMLWNVLVPNEDRKSKSFFHTGVGIHMLGVYPESNLVLVHRVDTEKDYDFQERHFYQMISKVWGSKITSGTSE